MQRTNFLSRLKMNTSNNEQKYNYSLAELGSVVTSSISQSVTAAEFRALEVANLDSWSYEDLTSILNRKNEQYAKIF